MRSKILSNPLGDIRAEADHSMLNQAFYETPDYLSLMESDDKVVVVGRRGTGKSALTYKLSQEWSKGKSDLLVTVSPDEHHTLALAPYIGKTGETFLQTRAACRLIWKYGLLLEILEGLSTRYKFRDAINGSQFLRPHLANWIKPGAAFYDKLRSTFKRLFAFPVGAQEVIAHFADSLDISRVEKECKTIISEVGKVYVLVDRLDEGFDPTNCNVAFIDGAVSAAIDLAATFRGQIRSVVFLRDNIYRAVAHLDQDYARNIEGQTLRLHWDVSNLFYLVSNRIRAAFKDPQENNKRLWNKYAAHELQGDEGFKRCLSFTLYRPRDILILLNSAFENASKRGLQVQTITVAEQDIGKSAKIISSNRLDDLQKEYRQIFPSINQCISVFTGGSPEMTMLEATDKLTAVLESPPEDDQIQLELAILERPEDLVRALYSVGFFGSHNVGTGNFVFSHDGKRPDSEFTNAQRLLIHPCYWMALDLTSKNLDSAQAAEIHDEYEIKVSSATPEIRVGRLNKIREEYKSIPLGAEGSGDFERWCLEAVRICFAGRLTNVELHPNKNSSNRRDIVGTNQSVPPTWQRIRDDYSVRQVIFEIKNYEDLTQTDYRQMLSYLSRMYGRLGFFICRSSTVNLERDKELDWFKSMHADHNVLIVKLSAKFLADILGKIRSPKRHYTPDQAISNLLDQYERLYLGQNTGRAKRKTPRAPRRQV